MQGSRALDLPPVKRGLFYKKYDRHAFHFPGLEERPFCIDYLPFIHKRAGAKRSAAGCPCFPATPILIPCIIFR